MKDLNILTFLKKAFVKALSSSGGILGPGKNKKTNFSSIYFTCVSFLNPQIPFEVATPRKINMEHNHAVWKITFLSKWVICRSHVNLPEYSFISLYNGFQYPGRCFKSSAIFEFPSRVMGHCNPFVAHLGRTKTGMHRNWMQIMKEKNINLNSTDARRISEPLMVCRFIDVSKGWMLYKYQIGECPPC